MGQAEAKIKPETIAQRPFYHYSLKRMDLEGMESFLHALVVFGTEEKMDILDAEVERRKERWRNFRREKGQDVTLREIVEMKQEIEKGWISFMKETLSRDCKCPLQSMALRGAGGIGIFDKIVEEANKEDEDFVAAMRVYGPSRPESLEVTIYDIPLRILNAAAKKLEDNPELKERIGTGPNAVMAVAMEEMAKEGKGTVSK